MNIRMYGATIKIIKSLDYFRTFCCTKT